MARNASQTYDYVVVGAGSAGCVLADRLSVDGAEVHVIEAGGPDRSPKIKVPAAFSRQFKTRLDWDYSSGPEPGCEGRSLYVPRGKALGGSSSMNAMLYVRGAAVDYDGWRDGGCEGWGWSDVLPYFMRSEDDARGASEVHGAGGPLHVAALRSPTALTERFIESAARVGIPRDPDYNDGDPAGASPFRVTQRYGRRWSTADAYLRPASKRANLTIAARSQALGIEISGPRAAGVRYRDRNGHARVAAARREVVLCAGAIGSPQLLMLSGIGPTDELRSLGVDAASEVPGVGRNLQDHPFLVNVYESRIGETLLDGEKPGALLEFLLRRRGPLTSTVAEAVAFVRSSEGLAAPDLEFHFAPAYFVDHGFEEHDSHAYTVGPVLVAPRSRGVLRLRSADPLAKPLILGNHLTEAADVRALLAGARLTREIVAAEPLAGATGAELYPGERVRSDTDLERDLRHRVELLYHPGGPCRMGTDDDAVVDPQLRVRGIDGLRVADASVMPTITRGNTNAPTVMIAERAAALIREA